jgi:hypothetical protein
MKLHYIIGIIWAWLVARMGEMRTAQFMSDDMRGRVGRYMRKWRCTNTRITETVREVGGLDSAGSGQAIGGLLWTLKNLLVLWKTAKLLTWWVTARLCTRIGVLQFIWRSYWTARSDNLMFQLIEQVESIIGCEVLWFYCSLRVQSVDSILEGR